MSNKGQFEYIEQRIREAAEKEQPAFDEKAWQGMEALLEKEEKKRRPFFWLWFLLPFLLAGGWGAYKYSQSSPAIPVVKSGSETHTNKLSVSETRAENNAQQEKLNADSKQPADALIAENKIAEVPVNSNDLSRQGTVTASALVNAHPTNAETTVVFAQSGKNTTSGHKRIVKLSTRRSAKIQKNAVDADKEDAVISSEKAELVDSEYETKKTMKAIIKDDEVNATSGNTSKTKTVSVEAVKKPVIKTDSPANNIKITEKKTTKSNKGFYVLGSIGADAGSVRLLAYGNSTITPKYGIGIGYQLSKKWSVQTGFYAANKKYGAGPNDYHAKAGTYMGSVQLNKVNAACLVYEIPLTVKFNFVERPAITYYAAAGISSYVMKKENYDYYYHYSSSTTVHEKYYTYTGNKHLFSVLTISTGIEKKLSSKMSLIAEPSVSIPLAGVGEGSVKLFSSSLLLGVKYWPFQKHN